MHILFVAGWWPTKECPISGIFIKEHADAISSGAKITVVYLNSIEKSSSWSDFPYSCIKTITRPNKNLTVIELNFKLRIRKFGLVERALSHSIQTLINEFRKDNPVDIIHLNILTSLLPATLLLNSKKFKLPFVLSEHSSFYHTEIYQLPAGQIAAKKKVFRTLFHMLNLHYIFPVSKELGDVLMNGYAAPAKKIIVIPNIANEVFCSPSIEKKELNDEIRIFAVAIWLPPKNPLLFFKMLSLMKQRDYPTYKKIKINWGGKGSLQEEVELYVKNELPDLSIHFMGLLPKNTIAEQLEKADFLVHPTDHENSPCIIIESLCAGAPVLSARINGIVELIDDSNGFMYEAGNVDDLYSMFVKMIAKKTYFDRKKIAAEARSKYSAAVVREKIIETYKAILT